MTTTTDLLRRAAQEHEFLATWIAAKDGPLGRARGLRADAASLLALAERMERPLAQDIKDAITELADGRNYPDLLAAVDLLASLQPSPDDVRDAERYRKVRRGQRWSVINGIGDVLRGEALDAAVDAMQEPKP